MKHSQPPSVPKWPLGFQDCSVSAYGLLQVSSDGTTALVVGTGADCRAPAAECSQHRRRLELRRVTRLT